VIKLIKDIPLKHGGDQRRRYFSIEWVACMLFCVALNFGGLK